MNISTEICFKIHRAKNGMLQKIFSQKEQRKKSVTVFAITRSRVRVTQRANCYSIIVLYLKYFFLFYVIHKSSNSWIR